MFQNDLAHSRAGEAFVPPEPIEDSAADMLLDAVGSYTGPIPRSLDDLRAFFAEMVKKTVPDGTRLHDDRTELHELLARVLFGLRDVLHTPLYVEALLLTLGKVAESEDEIARRLGVTKAAVSKAKTTVQAFFALPCRVGRKDEARAKFSALASARWRRQQQAPMQWSGHKWFRNL